jgi:hypothetical protein
MIYLQKIKFFTNNINNAKYQEVATTKHSVTVVTAKGCFNNVLYTYYENKNRKAKVGRSIIGPGQVL